MEWKANKNTICKNKIKNNAKFGIRTSHSWSYWLFPEPAIYCSGNVFYQNALADNLAGNARDDGENIWYSIHIKAGNYYDDYDGEDRNKDKIGDSPYIVEGVRICYYSDPFDDPEEKFRIPITHRDLYPLMDSNGKAKNMDKEGAFNAFLNYISTFSTQIQNIINRIYQKLEVNFL